MYTDPNRIRADVPGTVEGNPVFAYHDVVQPGPGRGRRPQGALPRRPGRRRRGQGEARRRAQPVPRPDPRAPGPVRGRERPGRPADLRGHRADPRRGAPDPGRGPPGDGSDQRVHAGAAAGRAVPQGRRHAGLTFSGTRTAGSGTALRRTRAGRLGCSHGQLPHPRADVLRRFGRCGATPAILRPPALSTTSLRPADRAAGHPRSSSVRPHPRPEIRVRRIRARSVYPWIWRSC